MEDRDNNKIHFYESVSRLIRDARTQKKMRQDVLASKLGITRTSLINIEKGRQHLSLFMLFEMAYHLDVSIMTLIPSLEDYKDKYCKSRSNTHIDVTKDHIGKLSDEGAVETVKKFLENLTKDESKHKQSRA